MGCSRSGRAGWSRFIGRCWGSRWRGWNASRDTFELVWQAEKYGARLALFGRKINLAEHQPTFIRWMRCVADGNAKPRETAIRGYHADIAKLGLVTDRSLDDDIQMTEERFFFTRPKNKVRKSDIHKSQHPSSKIIAEVAWMYYVKNLNQGEIADILSLSRPTVISYLKIAKERNIVCIQVAPEHYQLNDTADSYRGNTI